MGREDKCEYDFYAAPISMNMSRYHFSSVMSRVLCAKMILLGSLIHLHVKRK